MSLPPHGLPPVAELARMLDEGSLTSRQLVQTCLDRIARYDVRFRAVRSLAPDALAQADASDARRAAGTSLGLLDGIPVLVKDNVDVQGLPTTAGALALAASCPRGDAPVVRRLRAAGAVVLGKANLTELANFMATAMPSGYSSLGGQVLNPYDLALTPSGSSAGSAAAVALGYCAVAVGTETDGSITSPADHQSLVGIKPTMGLVSRAGIVPIASSQDTAGPFGRTVADAAALLAVLAGHDDDDPVTLCPDRREPSGQVAGARLAGVLLAGVPSESGVHAAALSALRQAGAEVREAAVPKHDPADELAVLTHEFARDVGRYLAGLPEEAPVRTLRDLARWNEAHAAAALHFGQQHVLDALEVDHEASADEHRATRERDRLAATSALEEALGSAEALLFPGADGCSLSARAGWPSVVVPAGYDEGTRRPRGLMLVSRPWTEDRLLALAQAVEQLLDARQEPWEVNPSAFRDLDDRAGHADHLA